MTRSTWIWLIAFVIVAGLAGGLASAFLTSGSGTLANSPSVNDLLAAPRRYYGHRVVVEGRVSAVYNAHAITLGKPVVPGLLVTAQSLPSGTRRNSEVRVTGIARRFSVGAWEQWSGGHSDVDLLDTFVGGPAVRAIRIERVGGKAKQLSTIPPSPQVKPASTHG